MTPARTLLSISIAKHKHLWLQQDENVQIQEPIIDRPIQNFEYNKIKILFLIKNFK